MSALKSLLHWAEPLQPLLGGALQRYSDAKTSWVAKTSGLTRLQHPHNRVVELTELTQAVLARPLLIDPGYTGFHSFSPPDATTSPWRCYPLCTEEDGPDYGFYLYLTPGVTTFDSSTISKNPSLLDINKPTAIYIHGWQPSTHSGGKRETAAYAYVDLDGEEHEVAGQDAWLDGGYNFIHFYWDTWADDPAVNGANTKSWTVFGETGTQDPDVAMAWRTYDILQGNSVTYPPPAAIRGKSVAQLFVEELKRWIPENYQHPIRIHGHSLGASLASSVYYVLLTESKSDARSLQLLMQVDRIALLDPYFPNRFGNCRLIIGPNPETWLNHDPMYHGLNISSNNELLTKVIFPLFDSMGGALEMLLTSPVGDHRLMCHGISTVVNKLQKKLSATKTLWPRYLGSLTSLDAGIRYHIAAHAHKRKTSWPTASSTTAEIRELRGLRWSTPAACITSQADPCGVMTFTTADNAFVKYGKDPWNVAFL